jgi:type I restriction enzyme S subunit
LSSHEFTPNFAESGIWREEWQVVKLGNANITDLIMGQSPPSSTYNNKGTGLPFLQGNAEFGDTYPVPILSCSQPIKIAEKNDILLSVRAPVGDVNINPFKSCIGRGLATIRPKSDKLNYLFLFYYLKFGSKKFESLSMGSTFKAIRKKEVENFQIPLPPLPEQRRIAEVLGTVDSAIQKVDGAIERTERLKQGLMQKLLTEGIGHERFKETKVGMVPEEWDVVRLEDVSVKITDGSHYSPKVTKNGKYRIATVANIKENQIDIDSCKKISNKDYEMLVKNGCKPQLGDILFSKDGTVGLSFSYKQNKDLFLLSSIAIIRPKDNLFSDYCTYILKSPSVFRQIIGSKRGTGLRWIILKDLYRIRIPFPPLPEQHLIAEILSTVDHKLELERRRKEKLDKVKKGLMNELLTGRKRVNLG